jgi:uncharacterized protein
MIAVAIADDDFLVGHLEVEEIDLLLCLGDLWDTTIERACERYCPTQAFAVRGNHDGSGPFPSYVTPLHLAMENFQGRTFAGFEGSWRYKPRGHHLFDQREVSRMIKGFPRVDVFIAHNSPRGYHERDEDVHQGFDAFFEYIQSAQPRYFIHGHQHLDATTQIGATTVISVFGEKLLEIE